ncbi:hypothetical protein [Streptomyces sp. ITFR-16]|uniref:hypothetical protein n=1 Tax=Streptomyces sp. ITFR-16 TaxID=3075198 RepID=UPI00288B714B|nr:hypothetical protein [Streptomyces sp. ITFR-16]WNI25982.1 hypothetical protein RLT58_30695 [Streptomyces sp. ITFR-16]
MPSRNRRLPRHLSWPLTPTDIRTALGEQESALTHPDFADHPYEDRTLLHVEWSPPVSSNYGNGIHPDLWSSVAVRVGPLPATERAAARQALREHALPELAAWIDASRRAPQGWTLSRHSRSWRVEGRATVHRDDWKPYRRPGDQP